MVNYGGGIHCVNRVSIWEGKQVIEYNVVVIVICFSFNKDDPVKVYPPSLREFSSDDESDVSSYDSDSDIS